MNQENIAARLFLATITYIFILTGCDGSGEEIQPQSLTTVTEPPAPLPPDTLPPAVAVNTGSVAGEGRTDIISASELAYIDQEQPPASILFNVTRPPAVGQLELAAAPGIGIQTFSQEDINAARVAYRHEKSHKNQESFEFSVEDGLGNTVVDQSFIVNLVPDITQLNLTYTNGDVTLTWETPSASAFDGVEIRRTRDGRYAAAPTDGDLVSRVQGGGQVAVEAVTLDTGNGTDTFYYTVFSFGPDGVYSGGVRSGLYCDTGICVTVPELRDLTRISSPGDAEILRKNLINEVWGVDTLPARLPDQVSLISDAQFDNAQSISELLYHVDNNISSRMRLYSPFSENGQLIIYHQGHRGNTDSRIPVIQRFLLEGFHVLEIAMPMAGYNWNPIYHPPLGNYHEDIAAFLQPMRYFLEPVSVGLNYAMMVKNFSGVYMTGISGGGWTTVVYAALDSRISASYPVAGSWPFYLRAQAQSAQSVGDFEQNYAGLYQYVSYLELYVLGAHRGRQLQIYNVYDDCCFEGTYANTFKEQVRLSAAAIGGSFDVVLDSTFIGHQISDHAVDVILGDIALR